MTKKQRGYVIVAFIVLLILAISMGTAHAQIIPSGAGVVQGTDAINRGYPVKVVLTDGNGTISSGTANTVTGNVADDGVDSGAPVKIGCKYENNPASVSASGDRSDVLCDPFGSLAVTILGNSAAPADTLTQVNYLATTGNLSSYSVLGTIAHYYDGSQLISPRGDKNGAVTQPALSGTFWQYASASGGIVSSTADVAVKAAAGASVRNFVCSIDISHDTLASASEIVIKDGATVLWRGKLQTTASDVSGGAGKMTFTPCLRGTANTAVNVAMITSTTGGVYVNLTGYTGS